jgi:hypothetical protein
MAKRTGQTRSEISRKALKRQLAVSRFREPRRKAPPVPEAQGLITGEDVFLARS